MSRGGLVTLLLCSCTVPALDELGPLLCDPTHPCPGSRACIQGTCSAAGGGTGGGSGAGGGVSCGGGVQHIGPAVGPEGGLAALLLGSSAVVVSGSRAGLVLFRVSIADLTTQSTAPLVPELDHAWSPRMVSLGGNDVGITFQATHPDGGPGLFFVKADALNATAGAPVELANLFLPPDLGSLDLAAVDRHDVSVVWSDPLGQGYFIAHVDADVGLTSVATALALPVSMGGAISIARRSATTRVVGTQGSDGGAQFYELGAGDAVTATHVFYSPGGVFGPRVTAGGTAAGWLGRLGPMSFGFTLGDPGSGALLGEFPLQPAGMPPVAIDGTNELVVSAPFNLPQKAAITCMRGMPACQVTLLGQATGSMVRWVAPLSLPDRRAIVFMSETNDVYARLVCW